MKMPRACRDWTWISIGRVLIIIIGLAAALVWSTKVKSAKPPQITLLDARLKILWAHMLKGTNTYYLPAGGNVLGSEGLGSGLEGDLRKKLSKLGVGIGTLPAFTPGKGPNGRAFLVSYAFPVPSTSFVHVAAVLVDQNGADYPLRDIAGGGGGPPERSWNLWALDSLPPTVTNYSLRLTLDTNGAPLAEIKFPEL
jgi:hypothetical protein